MFTAEIRKLPDERQDQVAELLIELGSEDGRLTFAGSQAMKAPNASCSGPGNEAEADACRAT